MTPRWSTTTGGTAIELTGRFPTSVPVFVWFDEIVVEAESTGDTLRLQSPPVLQAGVVDVAVKFRTSSLHVLTLADAFTFVTPSTGGGTGGSTGGGSGPATTAPAATAPVTSAPRTTSPPSPVTTTATPGTTPATTAPNPGTTPTTTPSPVTTTAGPGGPAVTAPTTTIPRLGSLTLRAQPTSGPVSRLSRATWPSAGCRSASCLATTM